MAGGKPVYAAMQGDAEFRRRNPQHLAQTLAFMLGRDDCHFVKFQAREEGPLRECLLWLRKNNPHLKVMYTTVERFGALYEQLQSVVPQVKKGVPVRLRRQRRLEETVNKALSLEDTLADRGKLHPR